MIMITTFHYDHYDHQDHLLYRSVRTVWTGTYQPYSKEHSWVGIWFGGNCP